MSEPFVGEIRMFAGNFAPRGWSFCDGQLLAISQNDALFSLLGTIYGGREDDLRPARPARADPHPRRERTWFVQPAAGCQVWQ